MSINYYWYLILVFDFKKKKKRTDIIIFFTRTYDDMTTENGLKRNNTHPLDVHHNNMDTLSITGQYHFQWDIGSS